MCLNATIYSEGRAVSKPLIQMLAMIDFFGIFTDFQLFNVNYTKHAAREKR